MVEGPRGGGSGWGRPWVGMTWVGVTGERAWGRVVMEGLQCGVGLGMGGMWQGVMIGTGGFGARWGHGQGSLGGRREGWLKLGVFWGPGMGRGDKAGHHSGVGGDNGVLGCLVWSNRSVPFLRAWLPPHPGRGCLPVPLAFVN